MTDPRRALVVDDNDVNRKLARTLLTRLDWVVEEADSGDAALALCREQSFELILLDISMPGLSGEETCQALRALNRPWRIIAYTAHAYPEERARFLAGGFDDILTKPINRETLAAIAAT